MVKSAGKLETLDKFVIGLADEYNSGFIDSAHSHEKTQLLYASSGVMSVITDKAKFVIPPQRAVWIPSHMSHEVSCRGAVSLRTLYINPSFRRNDSDCHIMEVGQLLHALIIEVTEFDIDYTPHGRERAIVDLLLNEISITPKVPYAAPMPQDPRLIRTCLEIINNLSANYDIDQLAALAFMSRRSFTRAFKRETGMGVAVWRQQVRLLEALSLLSTGASITSVAMDVGYESTGAFSTVFQRSFGVPPSKYQF
ncbi:MAG: helix-turn-helix transcriptional regulator [Paraglaciecola sp.]|uniref:AraC family transcriptional regulator n=1 Tax=Paraglaciecola sp. TaxID=1920173 RepID=UPI00329A2403